MRALVRRALIVLCWFACSLATEFIDKLLLTRLSAPLSLTLWKFGFSVPCGVIALLLTSGKRHAREFSEVLRLITPLGGLIFSAKFLTYVSYDHVPLSLSQTVKAATPVVSVVMTRCILKESFSAQAYLSLLPIVCGVVLAMGASVDFEAIGFGAALLSDVFMVSQSIYMKTLFQRSDKPYDTLTLNMHTAACCTALIAPVWAATQLGYLPRALDGKQGFDLAAMRAAGPRFWGMVLCSGVTQYGQSVASYAVVQAVSPVTCGCGRS